MINEIIAFVLGFITALIQQLIEKSKEAEQINWEEEERKREIEMGKDLKKKIKVEKNEK
jgi:hypothetical protein